jgi:hypothetical protein
MADYFTRFSMVMRLPNETAQRYAIELAHQACQGQLGDDLPADFPRELADCVEDWQFETEVNSPAKEHGVWLYSDYGGVDALCAFLQHLLRKYDPQGRVGFAWSYDCTKPRLDAYGGGAALVTAQDIQSIETSQWLQERDVTLAA